VDPTGASASGICKIDIDQFVCNAATYVSATAGRRRLLLQDKPLGARLKENFATPGYVSEATQAAVEAGKDFVDRTIQAATAKGAEKAVSGALKMFSATAPLIGSVAVSGAPQQPR
jgi:hypothetical protein